MWGIFEEHRCLSRKYLRVLSTLPIIGKIGTELLSCSKHSSKHWGHSNEDKLFIFLSEKGSPEDALREI
jgi:hypothetical protein